MPDTRQDFIEAQRGMLDCYGVHASSQFVDAPSIGGRAHVLVSGQGPPVVMLNGVGTPGAMWAPLMAELRDFQLLVVDLPAYGLTDPYPEIGDDLRRNAVVFLEQVFDGLRLERPAIVANSLGSLWSCWFALDRDRARALVHIGCPAALLDTSAPLPMRLLSVRPLGRLMTRLQPPSPQQVKQLSKMVNEYPLEPELADLLEATEKLPGFRDTFLSTVHAVLRLRGNRPEVRLTEEQLRKIHQPTLILWGASDPFGPPEAGRRMLDLLPYAEMHVVSGGHAPWINQATRIGEVVRDFLSHHI